MTNLHKLALLLLLLLLAGTRTGFAQGFIYEDRIHFGDSIKTIKVWTYIEGDKSFRRYQDAVESAKSMLNKKGYISEMVVYNPGLGIPAQEWMNSIIIGLKKNEAFLVIATQIKKSDELAPAIPPMTRILDENGHILLSHQYLSHIDTGRTTYSSKAVSRLFVNWNSASRIALIPVYSKTQTVQSRDVYLAVKYTLGRIPVNRHPSPALILPDTLRKTNIPIEICLFGGYNLPSQMDVLERSGPANLYPAKFGGNVYFGLEFSIGISKNIDLNVQYRRLGSSVEVNTPLRLNAGSVTINQNFMIIGTNYNFRVSKLLSPYAGICVGGINMIPTDHNFIRTIWYFDLGAQAGIKLYVSRRIGFRLQADLSYQVHPKKASFLYSDDVYHSVSVDAMSNMLQFGISGGFILRLAN